METDGSTSLASVFSSEQFLRNFGSKKIAEMGPLTCATEGDTCQHPRRTTLSGFPTASSIFDDPAYENILIDSPTGTRVMENICGPKGKGTHKELPETPTRSWSMVLNINGQSRATSKQSNTVQCKDEVEVSYAIKSRSPLPPQDASRIFDDPKYDKGLNLSDSRQ